MKILKLLFLLSINVSAFTQMLDNSKGETFGEKPFFNTNFIKTNKIKSIKGYYSHKATSSGILNTNNIYFYQFNPKGQLIKEYRTLSGDTIDSHYEYDNAGNLVLNRKSDKNGYHTYIYTYDSLNRLIGKEYRRDVNKSANKINFELDKSFFISGETFTYENTPIGLKKSYYNNLGKLYQTEFYYRDKNDYLLKYESQLITGNGKSKTTFTYGDKGLIVEKNTETVLFGKTTTKTKFEYDKNQNVLAQHYYRNGEYITEYQIIYSEKTGLLSAILTRDVNINFITIIKLTDYTFFN